VKALWAFLCFVMSIGVILAQLCCLTHDLMAQNAMNITDCGLCSFEGSFFLDFIGSHTLGNSLDTRDIPVSELNLSVLQKLA
ncbi:hypothetical protein STEG23_002447, partial [Scotinomys teguina]